MPTYLFMLQVPIYMGLVVDLTVEWERYKAAKEALAMDTLKVDHVKKLIETFRTRLVEVDKQLNVYLTEGVLTETYVVENLTPIIDCLRRANTSLRWIMLHRRTEHKPFRALLLDARAFQRSELILDFMLRTSLLELRLKAHIKRLLAIKCEKWTVDKDNTADMMMELTDYFSGGRALTRVARDEDLMGWFTRLSNEVRALDYTDAIMAGRKIRKLIGALDEVQQFDVIDASANIKEFLGLARTSLTEMVRTVNVTDTVMSDVEMISDLTFAWETVRDYIGDMHERIRRDPQSVSVFRALFLKLVSVVDTPLNRILQADSKDQLSVAEYYSGEVVAFLRKVMEVIPVLVFQTLEGIIKLQTRDMRAMPIKFELIHLRELSQLDARNELALRTHQISVFTEGTLAMKKTLLGVIKVDPRDILNDGIRKHLVDQISRALHVSLVFDTRVARGKDPKVNMEAQLTTLRNVLVGFRKSFEYVQDYIGIYGLRMWQEEFTRIIAFNTEQECNKFLRRRILPDASEYQSTAIPIPLFLKPPAGDTSGAITFMGRLVDSLVNLTDPRRTVYGPGCLGGGWYDVTGREIAGLGLFSLLNASIGVPGLTGADRLIGFSIERELSKIAKFYSNELKTGLAEALLRISEDLQPLDSASPVVVKHFSAIIKKLGKVFDSLMDPVLSIGHAQLLRRAIAHELRFSCRLDSNLLCGAIEALNTAVVNDVRMHYYDSDAHPMPDSESTLLPAVVAYAEAAGIQDPLSNIYVTTEAQPFLGLWLALLCVSQIGRFAYDREFACLVRRKIEPVDGGPFVAGLATLMKQAHPTVTADWLGFMGQYVRTSLAAVVGKAKGGPVPPEIVSLVLLMQHFGRVAHVPDRVMHTYLPSYVYETIGTF
jgi:WASH complex subunit strumpellin